MHTSRRTNHLVSVWLVIVAATFLPLAAAGEPKGKLSKFAVTRTWKDATGKFSIEGQLRHADSSEVQLTQSNGKTVKIPVEKLSDGDKAFIEGFLKAEQTLGNENADPDNPFKITGDKSKDAATANSNAATNKSEIKKVEPITKGSKQIVARMESAFWSAKAPRRFPSLLWRF